jgi:uncharacterized protein (DUF1800 family)
LRAADQQLVATSADDVAHLFRRAGFGALRAEIEVYQSWAWSDLVDLVLDGSRAPTPPAVPDLSDFSEGQALTHRMLHYWLDQARRPVDQAPVVEKVTLFLSGLLTASVEKTLDHAGVMAQNQLFRTLGLGDYRTLLKQVSVNTAMIRYLDNHHNVAGALNENFARELMELFSLGVGKFTQADATEAARAWTGHGLDDSSPRRYRFDPAKHDHGSKTILGAAGNFNGPDVIDVIVDHRRDDHARFMCHKLWSFFAYPVEADAQEVTDIVPTYSAGLTIRDTLRAIFVHPQFLSDRARWALVRSPIEYLVAVMRHTGTDCSVLHPEWWCTAMGQHPFRPPNVDGWGANNYWLTSSAALARISMLNYLSGEIAKRGDLTDETAATGTNPRNHRHTPAAVVDLALANYGIGPVSGASKQWLIDYVTSLRPTSKYWSERTGLLHLPLLLPELVMA